MSYAVEVNSYKVSLVDELAMLALKRLRKLGRLSKDMRKVRAPAPRRRADARGPPSPGRRRLSRARRAVLRPPRAERRATRTRCRASRSRSR